MQRFIRKALQAWPYMVALITGLSFFALSSYLKGDAKGLLLGIAGSFIAIPLLYLIYDLSQQFSRRRLTKELFDYAKLQVDREIFSAIRYLMKSTWPYNQQDLSLTGINTFLDQNRNEITAVLKNGQLLGFQILRHWEVRQKAFESVLEDPLAVRVLAEDQTIAVIQLLKCIRSLQTVSRSIDSFFEPTGQLASDFMIQSGKDLNESNRIYPDRHLLMRSLGDDRYQVVDFADFPQYQVKRLLQYFTIRESALPSYIDMILEFIPAVNHWLEITGGELLLDAQLLRMVGNSKE